MSDDNENILEIRTFTWEADPWDVFYVLTWLVLKKIERKNKTKKPLTLWALKLIDPATGWFEMREMKTKSADSVANVLEQAWLTRYPWPTRMIFDRGSEFKAELCQMMKNDNGVKVKPITTRNPQANAVVEIVHQTIGHMIRTFELYDNDGIDDDDPWSGILAAVMAAVHSTYSTTTHWLVVFLTIARKL